MTYAIKHLFQVLTVCVCVCVCVVGDRETERENFTTLVHIGKERFTLLL